MADVDVVTFANDNGDTDAACNGDGCDTGSIDDASAWAKAGSGFTANNFASAPSNAGSGSTANSCASADAFSGMACLIVSGTSAAITSASRPMAVLISIFFFPKSLFVSIYLK